MLGMLIHAEGATLHIGVPVQLSLVPVRRMDIVQYAAGPSFGRAFDGR